MSRLDLDLPSGRLAWRPGEELAGTASWRLDESPGSVPGSVPRSAPRSAPESVEVRLFWYTTGKGTRDVGLADRAVFEAPGADGRRGFRLTFPEGPYSFSGRLVSLAWAIELVIEPGGEARWVDLVMSPTGHEVRIDKGPDGDAGS
jgi:hypothetical protein